jgi:hypothetical protein
VGGYRSGAVALGRSYVISRRLPVRSSTIQQRKHSVRAVTLPVYSGQIDRPVRIGRSWLTGNGRTQSPARPR